MNRPRIDFDRLKNPLIMVLLSTTLSLVATLTAITISLFFALKKARMKDSLDELFPDYDWEQTKASISLRGINLKIYFDPGFFDSFPECESMLREKLIERSPSLGKTMLEIDFLPKHLLIKNAST